MPPGLPRRRNPHYKAKINQPGCGKKYRLRQDGRHRLFGWYQHTDYMMAKPHGHGEAEGQEHIVGDA
jgi:hypothetical protein